jgi:hypothetical protein
MIKNTTNEIIYEIIICINEKSNINILENAIIEFIKRKIITIRKINCMKNQLLVCFFLWNKKRIIIAQRNKPVKGVPK